MLALKTGQFARQLGLLPQKRQVTKIETVAEEYVASVGVVPEDLGKKLSEEVVSQQTTCLVLFCLFVSF